MSSSEAPMSREPLPPPVQSAGLTFLQRAAPILAGERGLTPRARLLLESLAREMKLSPEELEKAMAIVQRGEALAASTSDPQRSRFRELLKRQLAEQTSGILSANQEQKLVSFAVTQLAMPEEVAREEIRAVAAELGLRRVPLEEALRYIENVVSQKVGDELSVDDTIVWRLYLLGRDWGLDSPDIDALVGYRLEENAARQRRDKLWNAGLVGGSIVAAAVLLLLLIGITVRSHWSTPTEEAAVEDRPRTRSKEALSRITRPPSWWDAELTVAVSQARSARDDFAPVHEALLSDQPLRRAEGYALLIERASGQPFEYRTWKTLEPVIIGCYALEPDDEAVRQLLRSWMSVIQTAVESVPKTADGYQAAIRPLNSAVRAMKDKRGGDSRRQALADDVGRVLAILPDVRLPEAELQRTCLGALAAVLLERLADAVKDRPDILGRHYQTLSALARDRLPPEQQWRLDALLTAAAIEHAPSDFSDWQAIAMRGIESRDPLAVLRIVDALERSRDVELHRALAPRLLARLDIPTAGLSLDQSFDAMRKALGASLPAEAGNAHRWSRLEERAAVALQQLEAEPRDDADSLRQTAELAWHVNLAQALALSRPHPNLFDQWLAAGPPAIGADEESEKTRSASPGRGERLPRDQQETFDRYVHELGDWQKLDVARRATYLRGIANLASQVSDLSPIQARQLAGYLLGRKEDLEQAQVIDSAMSLRTWRHLRVALADGLERSQLAPSDLKRLVLVFSVREVDDLEDNPSAGRQALLRSVVDDLSTSRGRDAATSDLDRWAAELGRLYQERVRLFGGALSERNANGDPSTYLRQAVVGAAGRDKPQASGDEPARLVQLADRLAHSEVQACVLLQRAAIQQAAHDIGQRRPEQQASVTQTVAEFDVKTAAARDALSQLRDGEATLLQLWLLLK